MLTSVQQGREMESTFVRMAVTATLIGALLGVPQADGVHLVSSQPITATDNLNDPPVQFVPKMATKLGLPQPQNRDVSEISHSDEALASAVRQLLESHKRQAAYLERLVALSPISRIDQYQSHAPTKKSLPKKTAKPSPSSGMPAPESSVIMRPANQRPQPTEKAHSSENKETQTETIAKTSVVENETSDKPLVSRNNPLPFTTPLVYSNHVTHPYPVHHHFLHFLNPNSPQPLQPIPIGPFPPIPEDTRRGYSQRPQYFGKEWYPPKVLPHAYPSLQPGYPADQHLVDTVPIHVLPAPFQTERRSRFPPLTSFPDVKQS